MWLDPVQASHLQLATDGESQAKVIQKKSLSVPHPLILEKAHASIWEGSRAKVPVIIVVVYASLIMVVSLLVFPRYCETIVTSYYDGLPLGPTKTVAAASCCFYPRPPWFAPAGRSPTASGASPRDRRHRHQPLSLDAVRCSGVFGNPNYPLSNNIKQ